MVSSLQNNFSEGSFSESTLFDLDSYVSDYDSKYIVGDIERILYDPAWDDENYLAFLSSKDEQSSNSFPVHDALLNNVSIKVVTVQAPFALCLGTSKQYIIRARRTNYRGKVAVHCAAKLPSKNVLNQFSFSPSDFPLGKIIGFAELTDCVLVDSFFLSQQSQLELQGNQWGVGKFAWKLENFTPISQMISVSSKGSIWDLKSDLAFQMPSPTFSLKSGDFVLNGRLGQVIDSSSSGSIRVQYSDCVKSYDDLTSLLFLPTDLVLYFSGLCTSCQKSSSYSPTGSLVQYVENKKLKSGLVASYPKVSCDRDPNNVNHWRWGYYYEVKVDTKWKNRTLSVPSYLVEDVRIRIGMDLSISSIIDFILKNRRSR